MTRNASLLGLLTTFVLLACLSGVMAALLVRPRAPLGPLRTLPPLNLDEPTR